MCWLSANAVQLCPGAQAGSSPGHANSSSPSEVPTRRRSARISSDPSSSSDSKSTPASRLQVAFLDAEEAQSRNASEATVAELEA